MDWGHVYDKCQYEISFLEFEIESMLRVLVDEIEQIYT
jgi:hypothetical protein